jgi:hypothetical protein
LHSIKHANNRRQDAFAAQSLHDAAHRSSMQASHAAGLADSGHARVSVSAPPPTVSSSGGEVSTPAISSVAMSSMAPAAPTSA